MHETGCSELVYWDDPEGWDGEGGGRGILYQLSHQGSPRILEWVAFPFSSRIFLTQESNWGLLHCRQILYQLS